MKKIQYLLFVIVSLFIVSSCSNFEDLNTDPNKTTKVTPELLLTQIMIDSYKHGQPNANDFAASNLFCKHTAWVEKNANPYQYYYSHWPYGGFGAYKRLTDLRRMVEYAEVTGGNYASTFKGFELFMKATYAFQMTLDLGDIPYSEAGQGEAGNYTPKYDKQSDVFVAILNDLKQAEAYFADGIDFEGDIMYGGDVSKWRKLCNSTQLKVLQTMSKKISSEQKARFAEIVAANNLMEGNADNFKLVYSTNPNSSHPYWGNEGENNTERNFISKLAADELKKVKDRRLFIFSEPTKALLAAGKLATDFDAYEGAPTELKHEILVDGTSKGKYSSINWRYTQVKDGDPMLRFTYAEQCFIIAEAIEEGWVAGNAKDYYENGVKAMLAYYMTLPSASTGDHGMPITQDYINNYFTGAAAYKTAGTKRDRLEQVWIQRWLIDFFQGNGGNYPQFLRTGYPLFPLDPSTTMNTEDKNAYPKRWMYPTIEHTANPQNYLKAVEEQYSGYDGINKTPWYLQ